MCKFCGQRNRLRWCFHCGYSLGQIIQTPILGSRASSHNVPISGLADSWVPNRGDRWRSTGMIRDVGYAYLRTGFRYVKP